MFSIEALRQPQSWKCHWQQYGFTNESNDVALLADQELMLGKAAPQIRAPCASLGTQTSL
jgi:hypothetical protein